MEEKGLLRLLRRIRRFPAVHQPENQRHDERAEEDAQMSEASHHRLVIIRLRRHIAGTSVGWWIAILRRRRPPTAGLSSRGSRWRQWRAQVGALRKERLQDLPRMRRIGRCRRGILAV